MNTLINRSIKILNFKNSLFLGCNYFTKTIKISTFVKNSTLTINNTNFNLNANFDKTTIELNLKENSKTIEKKYPYIWLRDLCRCSECFNKKTEEKCIDLTKISIDVKPSNIRNIDNDSFEITWEDSHQSTFNFGNLINYAFNKELKIDHYSSIYWNKKIINEQIKSFPAFDYKNYLNEKLVLKDALLNIIKYGAVIIENVPPDPKETVRVCERIGPIQSTNYGESACVVTNNLEFHDSAYTNLPLKAHTDSVFLKSTPRIEMFHVIQTPKEGGVSLLVDGFYCANKLKTEFPEDFQVLCSTKVEFEELKKESHKLVHTESIIETNPLNNELLQIRYNSLYQINLNHLNEDGISKFYKALQNFSKIVQDTNNEYWLALKPNQVLIFDNHRLLHGRSSINGNRTLVTCYLNHDDWQLKLSNLTMI